MPTISTGDNQNEAWTVARWAFCGFLAHVKEEVGNDDELLFSVDQAVALDGLHLSLLEKAVAERLRPVLIRIADEAAAGNRPVSVEDRVLDSKSQLQFQNSTAELASLLKRREPDT